MDKRGTQSWEIIIIGKTILMVRFVMAGRARSALQTQQQASRWARKPAAMQAILTDAVMAAKACHESGVLTHIRPVELGRMVRKMGDYIMQHIDEIAPLFTFETGKPLWESRIEIEGASRYFEYYGNQAETIEGRTIPLGGDYIDFTLYEPFGVSAHIIPWNYPLEMTARSLAAALATGNACVIKTPELDPICVGYYIAQAAEYAGLPKGAVNLVCGQGKIAGAALSAHRHVNQIVFTGSVATGVAIGIEAAKNVVPCVLELGGKSAAILCDDADIESFTNDVRWGIYFNAGQVCSAMSRVIVPEKLHDRLVESVTEMARRISVGAGIDRPEFGANMGAMISKPQRDQAFSKCVSKRLLKGRNLPLVAIRLEMKTARF